MRFTRFLSIGVTSVRLKEFRLKPKSKGAKRKTPCDYALEHFDFFYGPIFQQRWPSIRLGLLCDAKICALMNNFTDHEQQLKELIELGAIDLLEDIRTEGNAFKGDASSANENRLGSANSDGIRNNANLDQQINNRDYRSASSEDDLTSESSSSKALSEFIQPSVRLEKSVNETLKKDIRPSEKQYLGPVNVDIVADEMVTFPKELKVMAFPRGCIDKFTIPVRTDEDVYGFYLLDAATIFAVLALDIKSDDKVLDMCCSPGGTSLSILQTMLPDQLICNDVSKSRTNKARNVLNQFIPNSATVRETVVMKAIDPTKSRTEWQERDSFDKVMVNVPCTNDRQSLILEKDHEENMFTPQFNAERLLLPDRQTKILKAGLKSLRKNGTLIYTTSTLSPIQNDAVVENALREIVQENQIQIQIRDTNSWAKQFERAGTFRFFNDCRYGLLIVPFLPSNFGPLYISKMVRVA